MRTYTIMLAMAFLLLCGGCVSSGPRPWIKSGNQGGNEEIQKRVIELKIQLEALKKDLQAIAKSADQIKDANDDIGDEAAGDTPDIPKIATDSAIIDNEVTNIQDRTDNAAGLTKASHNLAKDIQKEAQGKFKFSRFWILMFQLMAVAVVCMLANHYIPFFGTAKRIAGDFAEMLWGEITGAAAEMRRLQVTHLDKSTTIPNDELPQVARIKIAEAALKREKENG